MGLEARKGQGNKGIMFGLDGWKILLLYEGFEGEE